MLMTSVTFILMVITGYQQHIYQAHTVIMTGELLPGMK
jgi:hypothetical protein